MNETAKIVAFIPLISLGLVLNFGFVSIFVARNLFKSTKNILEGLNFKLSDLAIKDETDQNVLVRSQDELNQMAGVFYASVCHNLIHALAVAVGFIFLLLNWYSTYFNEASPSWLSLAFCINLLFLCFTISEGVRILMPLVFSKRRKVQYFANAVTGNPEEEIFPFSYRNLYGAISFSIGVVVINIVHYVYYVKKAEGVSIELVESLLIINLFLIFTIKVIFNLLIRLKLWRIACRLGLRYEY